METPQPDTPGSDTPQTAPAPEEQREEAPQTSSALTSGAAAPSEAQGRDKFEKWREDARRVLNYASQEAMAEHLMRMGDEHLLLGILRVNASVGADVLREMGVTLENVREALRAIRTSEPPAAEDLATDPAAEPDRITPTFRYAVEYSVREASSRRETHVRSDHILLALTDRRMPNISQQIFAHLGIDIKVLFTVLDERVHHTLYPPSPPAVPWYRRLADRLRGA